MTPFEIKRRAAGLTQAQLAERVGVTSQTVVMWEAKRFVPHPSNIPKLSDALGIPAEEVVRLFAPEAATPTPA